MNNLKSWALKHNLSTDAMLELQQIFEGVWLNTKPTVTPAIPRSEAAVQNMVRLEASKKGYRLWRNNVGAVLTEDGRFMRFGLCNDNAQMNKTIKSSDLVGIRKRLIFPDDVGSIIGQFVAREVKHAGWKFTGTDREKAQQRFIELIVANGGDASFCTGEGTL